MNEIDKAFNRLNKLYAEHFAKLVKEHAEWVAMLNKLKPLPKGCKLKIVHAKPEEGS